jgi:hypoxanthine phosphoribosyltransferase
LKHKEIVKRCVHQLGTTIRKDLNKDRIDEVTVVVVLTGGLLFASDLIRRFDGLAVHLEVIRATRMNDQGDPLAPPREVAVSLANDLEVAGKHVILVDDVIDSGMTLHRVYQTLKDRKPATVRPVALLLKEQPRLFPVLTDPADRGTAISCKVNKKRLDDSVAFRISLDEGNARGYVGFKIGPEYVVGYGLDYRGLHRNLSHITTLEQVAD